MEVLPEYFTGCSTFLLLWETVSNHFPVLLLHTIHDFTHLSHPPQSSVLQAESCLISFCTEITPYCWLSMSLLALSKVFVWDGILKRWLHYGNTSGGYADFAICLSHTRLNLSSIQYLKNLAQDHWIFLKFLTASCRCDYTKWYSIGRKPLPSYSIGFS